MAEFFGGRQKRSRSVNVSEQRRALLLPQEVKELGTEEAIIFYEGLRPIRCRKIRYYADSRFRSRLLAPPATPGREIREGEASELEPGERLPRNAEGLPEGDGQGERASSVASRTEPVSIATEMRAATAEDLERLDSLEAGDFDIDFKSIKIPKHEGPMTEGEMAEAVTSFLGSLARGERGGR